MHRHADKDKHKRNADDPENDEGADYKSPLLKIGKAKDAVVEHKKAEFRPNKVIDVKNFRGKEQLGDHHHVVEPNDVRMETHAEMNHGKNEGNNDKIPSLEFHMSEQNK